MMPIHPVSIYLHCNKLNVLFSGQKLSRFFSGKNLKSICEINQITLSGKNVGGK